MKKRSSFWKGFLLGMLLMAAAGTIVYAGIGVYGWGRADDSGSITSKENLTKLEYIQSMIDRYYLNEADTQKMTDGMYAGMVAGLEDPYSRYYTAEEYASMTEETDGHYSGIGVVMQQDLDGIIHLVRIYEDAPADKAGLLAGDILYQVDGTDVSGLELTQVAKMIKNPDTTVTEISVVREGETDYLDFEIVKEDVQIPVVAHEMLDDQVGYLAIYEFTSVTFEQYQNAYEDLKKQGMKRLVIDLRDNPGGLLESVCDILNTILPKGIIVYTEDKNGERDEKYCSGETPIDIPLAVLVNENSASASEIFSGAVQDYGVGTIVGTTTYGKGVVQSVRGLKDGSALKLTISSYYTPSGNNIDGKGITPDVEVELDKDLDSATITKETDNQLQKAIQVVCQD